MVCLFILNNDKPDGELFDIDVKSENELHLIINLHSFHLEMYARIHIEQTWPLPFNASIPEPFHTASPTLRITVLVRRKKIN